MNLKELFKRKPKATEEQPQTAEEQLLSAEEQPQAEPVDTKKKRKATRIIYFTLFGIFSAIFIFSAIYMMDYFIVSSRESKKYNALSDNKSQIQDILTNTPTDPDGSLIYDPETEYPFDTESEILPEYQAAYAANNDLAGWISIEGTVIDYPVMYRPADKDYYLHRNFYGEYEKRGPGAIFIREKCDPFKPSDNVVIYGHYKQDGSMFHDLHGYYRQSFWQEHQFIRYDTIYERHTYQIVAVFKTNVDSDDFFPYHKFNDAKNEEEFNDFINTVKRMSFYDTGVDAEFGDKLITLSTCEYTLSNGRLVVVAKQIS